MLSLPGRDVIARTRKCVCNSFRFIGLRGGFHHTKTLSKIALLACVCLASLTISAVLSRSAAAPAHVLGFDAISTELRAPLAWFALARPTDGTEKISAPITRIPHPDVVLFEKLLALSFGQPHANTFALIYAPTVKLTIKPRASFAPRSTLPVRRSSRHPIRLFRCSFITLSKRSVLMLNCASIAPTLPSRFFATTIRASVSSPQSS